MTPVVPNVFATVVFFAWGPVTLLCFAILRPQVAFVVAQLGGAMLLPELAEFVKVPGIPAFHKHTMLPIYSLLGLALFRSHVLRRFRFTSIDAFFLLTVVSGAFTAWTNLEPIRHAAIRVEAHTVYDAVNFAVGAALSMWLPMTLARLLFRTKSDLLVLLKGLVVLAAIYALPFLWEVRMSPRLHQNWYGYMQHDFRQTARGEGWRPMVFMAHGLAVAIMNASALIAATTLSRSGERVARVRAGWFVLVLSVLLAIGRSFGALVLGFLGAALVLFTKPRAQANFVFSCAVFVLVYPLLRTVDVFPHEAIVEWISDVAGPERAQSLQFRFDNEALLCERAGERPLFGWGDHCRACIHDVGTGEQISVADGFWVIAYGSRGLFGFLTMFLMMFVPIWLAWRRIDLVPDLATRRLVGGLTLIVGFNYLDYVPNSLFEPPLAMVLFGALYSTVRTLSTGRRRAEDSSLTSLPDLVGRLSAGFDTRRPGRGPVPWRPVWGQAGPERRRRAALAT